MKALRDVNNNRSVKKLGGVNCNFKIMAVETEEPYLFTNITKFFGLSAEFDQDRYGLN